MKVLHINNYDNHGGAETVFNLTRKNIPDTINYSGFVKRTGSDEKPDINFKTWESDSKLKGVFNYIFSFHNYKLLKHFLDENEIDIIHLHGFFSAISPSILLAIKKAKNKKKLKVIQTLHDFHLVCPNASLYDYSKNTTCEKCIGLKFKYPILFNNCDRRGFYFSTIKAKRSFAANNIFNHRTVVDHYICPSNFLKEKLIADNIAEEKISVIRNPVNVIQHDSTSVQKKNKICYFGRFSKEKNLNFLINAFTKWKKETKNDFQLTLIGEGEEEESLYQLKDNSSESQNISIKKFMPFDQLVKEIEDAKFFCMSSSCFENAPMSLLEAVSLNLIPIVPNIGGMKEIIEKVLKVGRTYIASDYHSFIQTLNCLVNHTEIEQEKLESARKIVFTEFNLQKYCFNIKSLYLKLLN